MKNKIIIYTPKQTPTKTWAERMFLGEKPKWQKIKHLDSDMYIFENEKDCHDFSKKIISSLI